MACENVAFSFRVGRRIYATTAIPESLVEADMNRVKQLNVKHFSILVLDKSGSMYRDYPVARDAVIDTIDKLSASNVPHIATVIFESKAISNSTLNMSVDKLKQWVASIECGGGTNIPEAWDNIYGFVKKFSQKYPDSKIEGSVVFFTDGQDCSGKDVLTHESINKLSKLLKKEDGRLGLLVHCIGFGRNHDAKLLGALARVGSSEGTFQYVQSSSEINDALEIVLASSSITVIRMNVVTSTGRGLRTQGTDRVTVELTEAEANTFLTLDLIGGNEEIQVPLREVEMNTPLTEPILDSILAATESALRDLMQEANGASKPSGELEQEVSEIDSTLLTLLGRVMKTDRSQRQARSRMLTAIQSARSLTLGLKGILGELRRGARVSNDRLAAWQDLSYRATVLKARDQRKLASRQGKNAKKLEGLEKQIEELALDVDTDELEKEVERDLLESTVCILSRANLIEAITEGDCICLALDVRRSPGCIYDPTQLRILSVGPTFVSAQTFMDILATSLSAETEDIHGYGAMADAVTTHGGFYPHQDLAKIFPGMAAEPITAAFPLYLHRKHWEIARMRSNGILSYMTTLDVAGGSGNEIQTIPFMVLFHLIKMYSTDKGRTSNTAFLYSLVLDTCIAVYEEEGMSEIIKSQFEKFMANPNDRTSDAVRSLPVLCAQLLCAGKSGDMNPSKEETEAFLELLCEELYRRNAGANLVNELPSFRTPNMLLSYISASSRDLNEDYLAPWMDAERQRLDQELHERPVILEDYARALNGEDVGYPLHFTHEFFSVQGDQVNIDAVFNDPDLKRFSEMLSERLSGEMRAFITCMDLVEKKGNLDDLTPNFEERTIVRPGVCQLALALQSRMHASNNDRLRAIDSKTYDPRVHISEDAARQFVKRTLSAAIDQNLNTKMKSARDALTREANQHMAQIFKSTLNLEEAAGLIRFYCRFRGVQCFHAFVEALQADAPESGPREDRPWDFAKLKMLVTGQYNSHILFQDEFLKGPPTEDLGLPTRLHWRPTRRNVYRTLCYFAHMPSASEEELVELFPTFDTYVRPFIKLYRRQ